MRGTRMGRLGGLTTSAACLLVAGCHGTTILDGSTPDGEDAWVDTADDPHVDPPDVPDAELSDPAVEDTACGDGLVACEGECVDTMVDMVNCGGCGIRCDGEHATEVCTAGVCEIVACEDGWLDTDWDPYNGCEDACTATAGSEDVSDGTCWDGLDNDCDGRTDLDDLDCTYDPPEYCNGLDDDCDTFVDEDFDCVQGSPTTCLTICGSTGTGTCTDTCEFPPATDCTPPAEMCNGVDDDCDTLVDEVGC